MRQKMSSFQCLAMNIIKRWNAIVPFEQRSSPTYARDGARVKLPNRIEYWMIMRVENIFLELGMAREMDRTRDFSMRHKCCLRRAEFRSPHARLLR
jgi:hypothetical protein